MEQSAFPHLQDHRGGSGRPRGEPHQRTPANARASVNAVRSPDLPDPRLPTFPIRRQAARGRGSAAPGAAGDRDSCAVRVIAMIPCILVYVALQRYYVRGLVSGALKG
jgi:hypothetical protein